MCGACVGVALVSVCPYTRCNVLVMWGICVSVSLTEILIILWGKKRSDSVKF